MKSSHFGAATALDPLHMPLQYLLSFELRLSVDVRRSLVHVLRHRKHFRITVDLSARGEDEPPCPSIMGVEFGQGLEDELSASFVHVPAVVVILEAPEDSGNGGQMNDADDIGCHDLV